MAGYSGIGSNSVRKTDRQGGDMSSNSSNNNKKLHRTVLEDSDGWVTAITSKLGTPKQFQWKGMNLQTQPNSFLALESDSHQSLAGNQSMVHECERGT